MKPEDIACLILASGLSQRFGKADKLQAELCGGTVLSHVIQTVEVVGFGKTYIVTRATGFSDATNITNIMNSDPGAGQGHALRLGLREVLESGWSHAMVVLGDMPLVKSSYLKKMIQNIKKNQSAVSMSEGHRSPPAIFSKSAIELILSQPTETGARALFDQLNPIPMVFDADSALDVDTPEDLIRVDAIMKSRST